MTFAFSDEALLIQEVAERFLQDRLLASPGGRVSPNDAVLWSDMAEMGWLGLPLPADAGGLDAEPVILALIAQAIGQAGIVQPFTAQAAIPLYVLRQCHGSEAVELAAAVAAGTRRAAFARSDNLRVYPGKNGLRIGGAMTSVAGGGSADVFLVAARYGGDEALFVVEADAPGVERVHVATIDGSDMADVVFQDVFIGKSMDIRDGNPALVDHAEELNILLVCAEAVGVMGALVHDTTSYSVMRQQFGRPLRGFQVVEHALADMQVALEEARSVVRIGLLRLRGAPTQRRRSVCAAIAKVAAAGRLVSHNAIQFHGAMGVTEELRIGALVKRLMALRCAIPDEGTALDQYATLLRSGACGSYLAEPGPDSGLLAEPALEEFRDVVSGWLDTHLDVDVARAQQLTTMVYAEAEVAQRWHDILHHQGWSAPNWPSEFGGTGWSALERYVWAHESAKRFAPVTSPLGLPLVGPVLFHFGTEAQKSRFLPPIVSGEELWCQGFSEPGAGSDLAALTTRATRDGDHYIVNGTKIWTTQGHEAQMMAALVRTGGPGSRREGISFLLIDMLAPGIDIRPIETIGGDHELNQIFFDDVRVPAEYLVGVEGQGWEIAKFLLEYERGGDIMSAAQRALLRDVDAVAVKRGRDDVSYRRRVASVSIAIDTLDAMELLTLTGNAGHPATPSILKLRVSETQQAITELGVDILGADAIRWSAGRPFHANPDTQPEDCFTSRYLNSRANTIFGGAREIQKTLIAKAMQ
ncbi:hypothetical protein EAO27_14100 [Sphingopyxis sp. YF1]|uniref:acyl-CoA dehydrogenase n=1 Tax=Sphingopyxis sp. YF1 TaxID=2482763 RepID=UPI001F60143C|nr:acyl-CoA dehydrogenase family protein [Sphingopyxis sp. YF1]UNU43728.1 hypothetical protein EAO27_14100 [Sphingopyxis sp. YF1]